VALDARRAFASARYRDGGGLMQGRVLT